MRITCGTILAAALAVAGGAEARMVTTLNDGKPFAVRGLSLRGTMLDIEMSGAGPSARFALNGKTLPDGFIPWTKLRHGRNLLAITLIGDTAK